MRRALMDELARRLADSPFATASWVDWLDLGLLTVLVHTLFQALRGTRAFAVLLGLGLLGLLWLVSAWVGLTTVHWFLDNLFVYAVIAVLILFQEDIRQVLARAGSQVLSRGFATSDLDVGDVQELVRGMMQLASHKTGALVVLQRGGELSAYTHAGQPLDAHFHADLLTALFARQSAFHDGAAVLHKGRVTHVGVVLPLSSNPELPRTLGTRHRAAVGLTERTDAICLVASEERGVVTLVAEGEIHAMPTEETLVGELCRRLGVAGWEGDGG